MSNWLFALVVLAFGVLLALFVDRHMRSPGSRPVRQDRKKWLYFWFLGRYPTKEEMAEDDKQDKNR